MTQANHKFRNKVYKTKVNSYVYIDANGDVGYNWDIIDVKDYKWNYGLHNHWIDKDGNLKMRSLDVMLLDYSAPEDLENV